MASRIITLFVQKKVVASYMLRLFTAASVFFLVCLLRNDAMAADESYVQTVSGKIKKGDSCTVIDDKFDRLSLADWNQIHNINVDNIISFELRRDTSFNFYNRAFTCTLNVTIKYFSSRDQETPQEIKDVKLVVKYDTASGAYYPVDASYRFKDAFKVIVVVNSITSKEFGKKLPDIFRIRNQIFVKRKYPFPSQDGGKFRLQLQEQQPAAQSGGKMAMFRVATALDPVDQKLDITWDPADFPGAEEYDLEWTYIDRSGEAGQLIENNYGGIAGPYNIPGNYMDEWMRFSGTRVTVTSPAYTINLPYTDGFILVRIRKVSYQLLTELRLTGNWVYLDDNNNTACIFIDHHNKDLNWQYTGTFAEQGKRKEVIIYFDATMRNRQMVTISNSDDKAIVAETVYDIMGRATMNILPAPLDDNKLQFYNAVNKNSAGVAYSHNDIEFPGTPSAGSCNIRASSMSNLSGASQYYSPNNPFIGNEAYYFTKYVPDADGYPFSVTEYTQDNTGRIRKQGGVGPLFQIGGKENEGEEEQTELQRGKETRYYYAKPTQQELDRLFGVEAGNASHYLKNLVSDPNGQLSVSYIDPNGKTIATALAGVAPGNVDQLASATSPEAKTRLNQSLIGTADFRSEAGILRKQAAATFVAVIPGNFTIHYKVNPASLITSPVASAAFCSNCYYAVTVDVKDECGNPVATKTSTPFIGNDITCDDNPVTVSDDLSFELPEKGEYTITYTLQLSEEQVKYQVDQYVLNNTDLKTLQMFLHDEVLAADLQACYSECSTCEVKLGSLSDFTGKMNALLLKLKNDKYEGFVFDPASAVITNWINTTYTTLFNNCAAMAATCQPASPCDAKLEQMKADVRPGGQYALYDIETFAIPAGESNVSILSYNKGVSLNYKSDPQITDFEFTDENGAVRHIKDANVTVAEFFKAYTQHPEWADDFVKRHIEYCSYLWCRDYASSSYTFDAKLRESVNDGTQAQTLGYYNRANYKAILDANKDPFFITGAPGASYKTSMQNDLLNASQVLQIVVKNSSGVAQSGKNILGLVDWLLYCKPIDKNATDADFITSWNTCSPQSGCRSLTREWELYRNYYLKLKAKYVQLAKEAALPNCKNCFIGIDVFSKGSCAEPGPLSDYTVAGNMVQKYLQYKNATAPFKDDYRIVVKDGVGKTVTVKVLKGQATVNIPNSGGDALWNIVAAVLCDNNNYIENCANETNVVPPCPVNSDFRLIYKFAYDNSTYGGGLALVDKADSVFLEFIPGIAGRPMSTIVRRNLYQYVFSVDDSSGGCNSYNTYNTTLSPVNVTFNPGDSKVFVGMYKTRYGYNGGTGCLLYQDERTEYSFASNIAITCPAYNPPYNPPSQCTDDPNFVFYQSKQKVFNEYVNERRYTDCMATNGAPLTNSQSVDALRESAIEGLSATKQAWIDKLKAVLEEENKLDEANGITPERFAGITEAGINTLAAHLYEIAKKHIEIADVSNIRPASSLPTTPSVVLSANGHNNFTEAFTAVVGASLVAKGFGPDLLEQPYPFDRTPFMANHSVSDIINTPICSSLVALRPPGYTDQQFHTYLQQQLKDDYRLSLTELQDLVSRCSTGCRMLDKTLLLPVAFMTTTASGEPHPFKDCTAMSALLTDFETTYPNVAEDTKLYRVLMTNYFNRRLGYALSYDEYAAFINTDCVANSNARLYNKPASPLLQSDDFACVTDIVASAFDRAGQEYEKYIEEIKRNFRNTYISKCLSNKAYADIEGDQYEYHYTLYYYDQSGNLVKTITPEGVAILQGDDMDKMNTYRDIDNACAALGLPQQENQQATFTALSNGLQDNSAKSLEMWLYDNGGATRKFRVVTPDHKYMWQAALQSGKLWVELYVLNKINNQQIAITASYHVVADVSTITLKEWSHLVIQSASGLASGAFNIYLDGQLLTLLAPGTTTPYPLDWNIGSNATNYIMPLVDVAALRHLRVYNREITTQEIAANMQSVCFSPEGNLGATGNPLLTWGRFNIPQPGAQYTAGPNSTTEYQMPFLVPQHRMPTNYYYNSLNQVVKQSSPDGGTSEFWYDRLGRLAVSQNEEQKSPVVIDTENPANRFSYTKYDALGRINEVGEKLSAANVTENDARNATWLTTWLASGNNRQVTMTHYDTEPSWTPASLTNSLFNLRKRVAATTIIYSSSDPVDRWAATYYSYDISGNVKTLTQENTELAAREQEFVTGSSGLKQIKYEYDLVSGKVNKVLYQDGKWDQFYYQYLYDADNRVVSALSSRNNDGDPNLWVKEATYHYYLHGPLARVELGKNKVQGLDYAYTLQGWLKGVNGQYLNADKDMSKDGKAGEPFANHGRDVLAFSLGYYSDVIANEYDYKPIAGHTNAPAFAVQYASPAFDATGVVRSAETGRRLYNGNISFSTYAIANVKASATYGRSYKYDQLNRLAASYSHTAFGGSATTWDNASIDAPYAEFFVYDANGNIKAMNRYGANISGMPLNMDQLTYNYNRDGNFKLINNRLNYITDFMPNNGYTVDIDNQAINNYKYDKIGNLVGDGNGTKPDDILRINWTVYGKIGSIQKASGTGIDYFYDAGGNRIQKLVNSKEDFYVRDAQGNTMGTYVYDNNTFTWTEQHLYGSSRLGMITPGFAIQSTTPLTNANYNATGDPITNGAEGKRTYELSNHLGNVMVTISDRKIGVDEGSNGTIDYYTAEVLTSQDYYAFGMLMPGRQYSNAGAKYKYGFNGKENDNEIKGDGNQQDYGMRIYDPRLGKFLSVDPLTEQYPELTPYQFASNRAIDGIDLDGGEFKRFHLWLADQIEGKAPVLAGVIRGSTDLVPDPVDQAIGAFDLMRNRPSSAQAKESLKNMIPYRHAVKKIQEGGAANVAEGVTEATSTTFGLLYGGNKAGSLRTGFNKAKITNAIEKKVAEQEINAVVKRPKFGPEHQGGEFIGDGVRSKNMPVAGKLDMGLAEGFLESATKAWGDQGLTVVGRAVQKHAGRKGSVFGDVKFSHKTANLDGLNILEQIMNSKNRIIQSAENGGKLVFDGTTGKGFGVSREGLFNGFRELPNK